MIKQLRSNFIRLTRIKVFHEIEQFSLDKKTAEELQKSAHGATIKDNFFSSIGDSFDKEVFYKAQIIRGFEFTYLMKTKRKVGKARRSKSRERKDLKEEIKIEEDVEICTQRHVFGPESLDEGSFVQINLDD